MTTWGKIHRLWLELIDRAPPDNVYEWHRWSLHWPKRTIDGRWTTQVWRRRRQSDNAFEYKSREETYDEWERRGV